MLPDNINNFDLHKHYVITVPVGTSPDLPQLPRSPHPPTHTALNTVFIRFMSYGGEFGILPLGRKGVKNLNHVIQLYSDVQNDFYFAAFLRVFDRQNLI